MGRDGCSKSQLEVGQPIVEETVPRRGVGVEICELYVVGIEYPVSTLSKGHGISPNMPYDC
jgi:hypothetical protein